MLRKRAHSESQRAVECLTPQLELNGQPETWSQDDVDEEGPAVFDSGFICYGAVSSISLFSFPILN